MMMIATATATTIVSMIHDMTHTFTPIGGHGPFYGWDGIDGRSSRIVALMIMIMTIMVVVVILIGGGG